MFDQLDKGLIEGIYSDINRIFGESFLADLNILKINSFNG